MWDILFKTIAKESGKEFASKKQLAELKAVQAAQENCQRCVDSHWPQHAKLAWLEHQKELQQSIARGDLQSLDGYNRVEFESEFAEKMEAAKRERIRVTREDGAPLVEAVLEKFVPVIEQFAADYAKQEADSYAKFGIPYPGPSALVVTLRRAADIVRIRTPRAEYANSFMRDILPFLDL